LTTGRSRRGTSENSYRERKDPFVREQGSARRLPFLDKKEADLGIVDVSVANKGESW
jgi:hypothetical protein